MRKITQNALWTQETARSSPRAQRPRITLIAAFGILLLVASFFAGCSGSDGAPAQAYYTFTLISFHIDNTRAWHEDTDTVAFSLKVDDISYPTQTKQMGDVNNGDHPVNLVFAHIPITSTAHQIVLSYQILNAGHASQSEITQALKDGADKLEKYGLGLITTNPGSVWSWVIGGGAAAAGYLVGLILANCDGPVAADAITFTPGHLAWVTGFGPYQGSGDYAGTDSPSGCGSNSQYTVSWSIARS